MKTSSSRKVWYLEKVMTYWKNQNDGMKEIRGAIMVLAIYIFISFPQMAARKRMVEDGTLDSSEELVIFYFKISSSFTYIAFLIITLLLITGFLVKSSRVITGLLSIFVPITLSSMTLSFYSSIYLVTSSQLYEKFYVIQCVLLSLAAAGSLLSLFHTICFLLWLSVWKKME